MSNKFIYLLSSNFKIKINPQFNTLYNLRKLDIQSKNFQSG